MTPQTVLDVGRDALWMCLLLAGGPLLAMLLVGLLVGMLQAATQINEMTLSFVPKLIVMALVLVLMGPWLVQTLVDYTQRLVTSIPGLVAFLHRLAPDSHHGIRVHRIPLYVKAGGERAQHQRPAIDQHEQHDLERQRDDQG